MTSVLHLSVDVPLMQQLFPSMPPIEQLQHMRKPGSSRRPTFVLVIRLALIREDGVIRQDSSRIFAR